MWPKKKFGEKEILQKIIGLELTNADLCPHYYNIARGQMLFASHLLKDLFQLHRMTGQYFLSSRYHIMFYTAPLLKINDWNFKNKENTSGI